MKHWDARDIVPKNLKPKTSKPRIVCFTESYPEFSETYMHEEFLALSKRYEVLVIALHLSAVPRENALPFILLNYRDVHLSYGNYDRINMDFTNPDQQKFLKKLDRIIGQFKPDVMHAHYLYVAWLLRHISERYKIPFTVRTHSFDMLEKNKTRLHAGIDALKSPMCVKVFAFPEFVSLMCARGVDKNKVRAAWPVVNVERFYNELPRELTGKIMCAGPCIKKKAHTDFIDLAKKMQCRDLEFSLYAKGFDENIVTEYNSSLGSPVALRFAEPEAMAEVYRKHDWIVYPSDTEINRVGLPVAVAEAQASGIGVCLQELPGRREAQEAFLGGGGFIFKSIKEVPDIISQPYPETMRVMGLENSTKFDVKLHVEMLDEAFSPFVQNYS